MEDVQILLKLLLKLKLLSEKESSNKTEVTVIFVQEWSKCIYMERSTLEYLEELPASDERAANFVLGCVCVCVCVVSFLCKHGV
jgi:uncharacterized protein YbbC (DUF1343 family)